jgi:uncharacterized membrane protein YphA (DoxX/SURF4 family)
MIHAIARIILGALLVFSAWTKLSDPLLLAYALREFHLGWGDEAVVRLAFVIPWIEAVAGASLLLGLWPKSGAVVAIALFAIFVVTITRLRIYGLKVDCPCFGQFNLFCAGPLGTCHIVRNVLFSAVGVAVLATPADGATLAGVRRRLSRRSTT